VIFFSGISSGVDSSAMVGERKRKDKSPRHCAHYSRNNHTSEKCWDKFSKSEWAQIADTTCTSALVTTFSTADFTV